MENKRKSGILLHITSLPGKFGIGSIGNEAFNFVDFLIQSKQKIWQILPLGHTGFGDSPYQCYSAFAGNPILIDLEKLADEGWSKHSDLENNDNFSIEKVEFEKVLNFKMKLIKKAVENFQKNAKLLDRTKYENFCNNKKFWLNDYAFYVTLKEHFEGKPWYKWEHNIKTKDKNTYNYYFYELKEKIESIKIIQYFFFKQWHEIKSYANLNGIQIIGDIPLYVAYDSADAWTNPDIFQLDVHGNPIAVAGVPPDYFSETGQLWGNPLYDWNYLKETGFKWWIERVKANFVIYDILRIDHFRGLCAYWSVPYGEETAVRGEWINAPGKELIEAILKTLGNIPIIAEDLGVITPDVEELRDSNNLPGMKILQFAFDSSEANNFLPHTYSRNCIVYTGAHDNDTTLGWYKSACENDKQAVREYFTFDENHFPQELIKLAWSSVANIAIAPLQDILELDTTSRMNMPGTCEGNWMWRFKNGDLNQSHVDFLRKITKTYTR